MKSVLLLLFVCVTLYSFTFGQISLDGIGTYNQDFNTLANVPGVFSSTLPLGWALAETGTSIRNDGNYDASHGNSNTGDTYSFGAASSTERAFGGLRSGTLVPIIGAQFANNTGFIITQIPISYTGEQWRAGVENRNAADRLEFQFSTDAISLTTGTWTDYNSLDFPSPNILTAVGPLDGNASGNRTTLSFTIAGLSIPDGATFWIRWTDFDIASSDDGLAIDDFSIDETSLPVELSSFSAIVLDNAVMLKWRTETEVSNYGFEIERASSLTTPVQECTKIGFVEGNGNSNSPKDYSFIDQSVSGGKYSYRLKQLDTDGSFEYSKVIEIDLVSPTKFELSQNYPNPFNPVTTIKFSVPQSGNVKLTVYNLLGEQIAEPVNGFKEAGIHTINFSASNLNSGIYIYKIEANSFVQSRKMTLIK